jgi:hypothetical protein
VVLPKTREAATVKVLLGRETYLVRLEARNGDHEDVVRGPDNV